MCHICIEKTLINGIYHLSWYWKKNTQTKNKTKQNKTKNKNKNKSRIKFALSEAIKTHILQES